MSLFLRVNHPQDNGLNICTTYEQDGSVTIALHKGDDLWMLTKMSRVLSTPGSIKEVRDHFARFARLAKVKP